MVSIDQFTLKARIYPPPILEIRLVPALERFFFAWISMIAALVFLPTVLLALIQIISFTQLLYVYASISGITVTLAFLLYCARRNI